MDTMSIQEKYEDLLRRFDGSGPDDCATVTRDALAMLRGLVTRGVVMDIQLMQEKYENLRRSFDEAEPDDCATVASEALDMLHWFVHPDYAMDGPGFWVARINVGAGADAERQTFGPFASDEEALRWAQERSPDSWTLTRISHPSDYRKREGDE